MADRRPDAGEFAVANHGNGKQGEQLESDQGQQGKLDLADRWNERSEDEERQPLHDPRMGERRPFGEDEHKTQEIKRQRRTQKSGIAGTSVVSAVVTPGIRLEGIKARAIQRKRRRQAGPVSVVRVSRVEAAGKEALIAG
jgi:hypothetical protein